MGCETSERLRGWGGLRFEGWKMKGAMLCFLLLLSIETWTFSWFIPRFQFFLVRYENSIGKLWAGDYNGSGESKKEFLSSLKWSKSNRKKERRTRVSWITSISSSTIIQSAFDRPKVINLSNDIAGSLLLFFSYSPSASSFFELHDFTLCR